MMSHSRKKDNVIDDKKKDSAIGNIINGIIVTVIGGIILAVLTALLPSRISCTEVPPPSEDNFPYSDHYNYVFYVYKDNDYPNNHYENTLNMGSTLGGYDDSIKPNFMCADNPKSGSTCMKFSYTPQNKTHWAGMMWTSGNIPPPAPPEDGVDTNLAEMLIFWARGTSGKKITFYIENTPEENKDKKQVAKDIILSDEWTEYTLELPDNWNSISVGFGWSCNYKNAGGNETVLYLDEIAFCGKSRPSQATMSTI